MNYDVIIASFSRFETDARTSNLAFTLARAGIKTAWIGLGASGDKFYTMENNLDMFPIFAGNYSKFFLKRIVWQNKVNKLLKNRLCKVIWAADFYVLPTLANLKTKLQAKLIYDSREIYSALGTIAGKKLRQEYITYLEKRLSKKVDYFTVSGELDAEYLKRHLAMDKDFQVILNLPNYREYKPSNKISELYPHIANKTKVVYQGVVLAGRGIEPVIESLRYDDSFAFVVFGDGSARNELIEKARHYGISDRILFPGTVPYSELLEYTASADIGVCYVEPISFSYELALPNKLFEYIMSRIPVLCSDLPAMRKVIDEHGVGELIAPNSTPKDIHKALVLLSKNKAKYMDSCAKAAEIFNYEKQKEAVLSFILRILETGNKF